MSTTIPNAPGVTAPDAIISRRYAAHKARIRLRSIALTAALIAFVCAVAITVSTGIWQFAALTIPIVCYNVLSSHELADKITK
jgi:hypothetical protein